MAFGATFSASFQFVVLLFSQADIQSPRSPLFENKGDHMMIFLRTVGCSKDVVYPVWVVVMEMFAYLS
jgi:hypothetical protein